jgi:plastocyanin
MKLRTSVAAAAALALVLGLAACGSDKKSAASPPAGSTGTSTSTGAGDSSAVITMKNLAFTPTDLTVAPGTEVMVMNADTARHNLQDKSSKGKAFNTGDLDAGKNGAFKAPTTPGDYPYLCKYHFGMEGVLHVK